MAKVSEIEKLKARIKTLEDITTVYKDIAAPGPARAALGNIAGGIEGGPVAARVSTYDKLLNTISKKGEKALARLSSGEQAKIIKGLEPPESLLTPEGIEAELIQTKEQRKLAITREAGLELERLEERALKINQNVRGMNATAEKVAANDARIAELKAEIVEAPLSGEELQKRLQTIRPYVEAEGEVKGLGTVEIEGPEGRTERKPIDRVGEITTLNDTQVGAVEGRALEKLSKASGKTSHADLDDTVKAEFVREINNDPDPKKVDAKVKEFVPRQAAADVVAARNQGLLGRLMGFLSGRTGAEEGISMISKGDIAKGTQRASRAKLKGRGAAGLGILAIPLLLSLLQRGQGDEPGEEGGMQSFLQGLAQEAAGKEALMTSRLNLNQARQSRTSAQAEGEILRNLLLMNQLSSATGRTQLL